MQVEQKWRVLFSDRVVCSADLIWVGVRAGSTGEGEGGREGGERERGEGGRGGGEL